MVLGVLILIRIYTDGSGNGYAVAAAYQDNNIIGVKGVCSPGITNNMAEYQGVINALELIKELKIDDTYQILTDSQLVMGQLFRYWRINEPKLRPSWLYIKNWLKDNKMVYNVTFKQIPRKDNLADAVLREYMRRYNVQ